MIKKSDLTSLSDKTKNTINTALSLLPFVKKEEAEQGKDTLSALRAEFAAELSRKNTEYEDVAKKAFNVIKSEYIPKIEEYGLRVQSKSIVDAKSLIDKLSVNFIDSARSMIHVDDKGFSVSNISTKMANYNITSPYADYIRHTADTILKLQEICTKHEEQKTPNSTELKSNFDTFCVKTQNMLFYKYLDMLSLLDKIEYMTQLIDALTILSIVISEKRIFSKEAALNFLNNNPFDNILRILRRCDYID